MVPKNREISSGKSYHQIPDPNYWENPFVNDITPGVTDYAKLCFMTVFVVPIRLCLIVLFFLLAYLVASISLLVEPYKIQDHTKPFSPWRKKTRDITAKLLVVMHVFAGFRKIKFKGRRAQPWEAPLLIAGPHCSFWDTLPVVAMGAPSLVGKSSLVHAPLIGKMILLTQPITVTRECRDSRKETIEKIQERDSFIN